jgi:CubicO group peptidase (beta-lactamase class C family)
MRGYLFLFLSVFSALDCASHPAGSNPAPFRIDTANGRGQHIGQSIHLLVDLERENPDVWLRRISEWKIGAVTVTGGSLQVFRSFHQKLGREVRHPLRIYCGQGDGSFVLPLHGLDPLPGLSTALLATDSVLIRDYAFALEQLYRHLGLHGSPDPLFELRSDARGMRFSSLRPPGNEETAAAATLLLAQHPVLRQAVLRLNPIESQEGMPDSLQIGRYGLSRHSPALAPVWPVFNQPGSRFILRECPAAVMTGTTGQLLVHYGELAGFRGQILADVASILSDSIWAGVEQPLRALLDAGADELLVDWATAVSLLPGLYGDAAAGGMAPLTGKPYDRPEPGDMPQIPMPYGPAPDVESLSYRMFRHTADVRLTRGDLIPVAGLDNQFFASLTVGPRERPAFQESLDHFAPFVHLLLGDALNSVQSIREMQDRLATFDLVVINLGDPGLSRLDLRLRDLLFTLNLKTRLVVVGYGSGFDPGQFPGIPALIHLPEENAMTDRMAAQIIFGAWPFVRESGRAARAASHRVTETDVRPSRLSFSTPGLQGMDPEVLSRIDSLARSIIASRITPGCQVLVARNGYVIYENSFGHISYDNIVPVDNRTLYDLASVTKVAATTQMLMSLYGRGLIGLDQTVGHYLPETMGTGKENLVLRDVLLHQSGLRPFLSLWGQTASTAGEGSVGWYAPQDSQEHTMEVAEGLFALPALRDSLWHWTLQSTLLKKTNPRLPYTYRYSDLGMFILYKLAERVTGVPMERYLDSVFYRPMGLGTLTFNPLCRVSMDRVAPTEYDHDFRKQLVWGTVHDPMAAMNGGVAGHAGLFGNAHDLAAMLYMNLQGGVYGGSRYLADTAITTFTGQQSAANRRGLGWDRPAADERSSPASRHASAATYGHLGFTGTAAWADPTFNLVFVFLSNRVHPSARNNQLNELSIRKKMHDIAYDSILSYERRHGKMP